MTGPEDEFDPAVNGDPDSTTGEEPDAGEFDEMPVENGWDDESDEPEEDDEE